MGFFTGSTKTYVSSVVYNLAGDINKRPDYLKTTVVGAVLGDQPSIADSISNSYLQGPGLRLKSFAQWARTGTYNTDIGLEVGTVTSGHSIDSTILAGQIPLGGGTSIEVQSSMITNADFTFWADQYVAINRPSQLSTPYDIAYNVGTNTITITYADTTTASFTPAGYNASGTYLYATYMELPSGTTPLVFIYQYRTGNSTLDAMWAAPSTLGSFFPFIPFRINNQKVTDVSTSLYDESVTATKKALNAKYDDIETNIETNSSIGDIDFAYAAFGVCLNTQENSCKKYVYKFFQTILEDPTLSGSTDYTTWEGEWLAAKASWDAWNAWYTGGMIGIAPTKLPFPAMLRNSITVGTTAGSAMNYNMTIEWNYMYEESGSGLLWVDGTSDELRIETATVPTYADPVWTLNITTGIYELVSAGPTLTSGITIGWQVNGTHWQRITLIGLKHRNLVYNGNAVEILAEDALADADESGFLVPLHEDIYKSLSIKDYTQMSTACCYLIFNCYTIVKTHWYQTGFFQFLLIVAIIVLAIICAPIAMAAMPGLLGANAAIGGILGLTGAMATLVGAIANALAAMILMTIINKVAVAALGPKLGQLIGTIVGFVTMALVMGLNVGKSISEIFKDMMNATNLIALTNAVGNGIAGYIKGVTAGIETQITDVQKQTNDQLKSIEDQMATNFGTSIGPIDMGQITDVSSNNQVTMEPSSVFLTRTLMTGSDIADLSMSMITNFTDLTLNLDLLPA